MRIFDSFLCSAALVMSGLSTLGSVVLLPQSALALQKSVEDQDYRLSSNLALSCRCFLLVRLPIHEDSSPKARSVYPLYLSPRVSGSRHGGT